ncbi:MAG: DUF1295 domain-containing protein [Alphaproteobacteria bacterium]|nr:DUF1295 domain-containing protein [Alphaproteobacteria bacterium]
MDLYSQKAKSIPQKIIITLIELALIYLSYNIMFGGAEALITSLFNWELVIEIPNRRWVILIFSIIILLRMAFMMFYLLKRKLPWSECFTVPAAFALYYVGFAILVLPNEAPLGLWDWLAMALFLLGCHLNTASEFQRHKFKLKPENKGKLYTKGLFAHSMHINYFGDILWIIAYTIIAGHIIGIIIPIMIAAFFAFFNIPMLDNYLRNRYPEFTKYEAKTKKLIPFIW